MAKSTAPLHVARAGASAILVLVLGLAMSATRMSTTRAAPDRAAMGKPLYDAACAGCHEIGRGARDRAGPSLNGVLGRPAGARRGFTYSTAMRHSAVVWTHKALDTFLADPRTAMPGTEMVVPAIRADAERAAIAAYIERYQADGTLRRR